MDKLLEYFINEPAREFHIRELSKLTGLSPTTVSKYLAEFEKNGILISKRKFNHLLFKANSESTAFKNKKLFYNVGVLEDSGLIDFLDDEFNHPESIVLFGSFRKAENIPASDIDILIIGPAKKNLNLEKFEKKLGHKIQLFVHSRAEIEKLKLKSKDLVNNWLNGIVLRGYWEILL
ncbi:MAG: nucleotidyltransferase domain-containing protein [DPANN group archaeon]|nr:nucleotidyltransferase domain-containing protein [DPANN group archaeon]